MRHCHTSLTQNIKLLTHYKNIDVFVKSSPPTPWTPRPASVSFLLVEEEQQKQQVIKERGGGKLKAISKVTTLVSRLISEVVAEMLEEERKLLLHQTQI